MKAMPSQTSMMAIVRDGRDRHESTNKGEKRADTRRGEAGVQNRKRIRNFTPNDRAAHRVFEKSRREAFREKLIVRTRPRLWSQLSVTVIQPNVIFRSSRLFFPPCLRRSQTGSPNILSSTSQSRGTVSRTSISRSSNESEMSFSLK